MTGQRIRFDLDSIAELAILHRDTLGHTLTPTYTEDNRGVRTLVQLECSCGEKAAR